MESTNSENQIIEHKYIYTSNQILAASFFGGPLGLSYMVGKNAGIFGYKILEKFIYIIGITTTIGILYSIQKYEPNMSMIFVFIGSCFQVDNYKNKVNGFLQNGWKAFSRRNEILVSLLGAGITILLAVIL